VDLFCGVKQASTFIFPLHLALSWDLPFSAFAGPGGCAEDSRATMAGNFSLYDQRLRETERDGSGTRMDSTTLFDFAGSLSVDGLIPSSHS